LSNELVEVTNEEVPKTKRGWKFLRGRKLEELDERQAPLIEHVIHIDCRDGEDEEETSYYFDEYYHQVRTSSIEMILVILL
jgi:hypothetical protein